MNHRQNGTPDQLKSKAPSPNHILIGRGGGVLQTNSNPKCQVLTRFSFSGEKLGEGGRGLGEESVLQTNSNAKCQVLTKLLFSGGWGWVGVVGRGEGAFQTTFLKYLSRGHSRNFEPKILVTGMWWPIALRVETTVKNEVSCYVHIFHVGAQTF